jgi:hypothetical protein
MKGLMNRQIARVMLILITCSGFSAAAQGATPATLPARFDPARHMRVSEVRPGMTGYGLTVMKGTQIERFGVEVMSILRDFNPKYDVILVRCHGANLEHTGSIAGMSGSPIYLRDDNGNERLVGAFAYGWPLMKDPIGGVQPIEYMLGIPTDQAKTHTARTRSASQPATEPTADDGRVDGPNHSQSGTIRTTANLDALSQVIGPPRWKLSDSVMLPGMTVPPPRWPLASIDSMKPNPRLMSGDDADVARLRPLATPLMISGLPTRMVAQFEPLFRAYGLVPLQAGGLSGKASATTQSAAKLEPGSVLAVPLLTGDVEMTAVGTCTEVIGDNVYGFGHPFNNEGPINLPVGPGEINGVIANLMTSFKLGAITGTAGTLYSDDAVGVAGKIGVRPPTIPIHLTVRYTDGSGERSYAFQGASHPRLTPLIGAAAMMSAVSGVHELPQYNTLDYDVTLAFNNGQSVHLVNSIVNASAAEIFYELGMPMVAASDNPFDQVGIKRIDGTVNISPEARDATILWANVPRLKFRPGETLKAYVDYRPFRGAESIRPITFDLPKDLPEGDYQFSISGWHEYLTDEQQAKPFRFAAETSTEVFDVLRELTSVRHDSIYLRLIRQADGIAIGRTAMPNLPSSRREVLIGAGRSNTTPFVSSSTKVIPMGYVMDGTAAFQVTIDKNAHVETGVGKPPRHESPAAPPARIEEPKGKPAPAKPEIPIEPGT